MGDDGKTVIKREMLPPHDGAFGPKLDLSTGKASFYFTINATRYEDAHMFMGVADCDDCGEGWGFSPPVGSLYIFSDARKWGKETKTKLMEGDLMGKQIGATVECTVDLEERSIFFSINGAEPVDCGIEIPDDVDDLCPWAFLCHPGDSVTLTMGKAPP